MKNKYMGSALVDFLVFLCIILALAFGISAFLSLTGMKRSGEEIQIEYTVRIKEVRAEMAENIRVGDALTESSGKHGIGEVTQIYTQQSVITVYAQGQELAQSATIDDRVDVILSVRARGKVDGSDIRVNGYALKIGKQIYMRLPFFVGEGKCEEIIINE